MSGQQGKDLRADAATLSFAVFGTAIGDCAVVWNERAIVGALLPEPGPDATARQARCEHPGAVPATPPPSVATAIEGIVALLAGRPVDLSDVELDLSGHPEFERRVWRAVQQVPPGRTVSYGQLADQLGAPGAARAVGRALGHNPCPIIVPCHRVLAADGSMHGFSAPGGVATKRRMLEIEGAVPPPEPVLF